MQAFPHESFDNVLTLLGFGFVFGYFSDNILAALQNLARKVFGTVERWLTMLNDVAPPQKTTFESHAEVSRTYGVKAAGMSFVPAAWRLDFAALSIAPHRQWMKGEAISSNDEVVALQEWLANRNYMRLILRSSGTRETISDRGKFRSLVLQERWNFAHVVEKLEELYCLASKVDSEAELGVVVQEHLSVCLASPLMGTATSLSDTEARGNKPFS